MASTGKTGALTARRAGLVACHVCGKLQPWVAGSECSRCGSMLHQRKPDSLQRSWAFLVSALLLYFPANLYPIMTTTTFGVPENSTIIGGVILLWQYGSYPVAAVVFIASVMIPIIKFLVIGSLLLLIRYGHPVKLSQQTRLFRLIEYIGPWSMIDVFVVAILASLVRILASSSRRSSWATTCPCRTRSPVSTKISSTSAFTCT